MAERDKQIVHLKTQIILLGKQKVFDVTLNFHNGGALYMNIEGQQLSCLEDDFFKFTRVAPLCYLNSLC